MLRRVSVILILAGALGVFLYLQPWKPKKVSPRFFDRLPEANFIGKSDLLRLSRSLTSTMFYYKIPFREFVSPEFILGQAKGFGLNVQAPIYFFGDEKDGSPEQWGMMVHVTDSSKIIDGVHLLRKLTDVQDTSVHEYRVFKSRSNNVALAYGKDWLLATSINGIDEYLKYVLDAQRNGISPRWRHFLNDDSNKETEIIVEGMSPTFQEMGIQSIIVSATNDSTDILLQTQINQFDSLHFSLKQGGLRFHPEEFTKHLINAHFDVSNFRKAHETPAYQMLNKLAGKVSFPVQEFFDAWEGDIAFRQGGFQTIREKYIESEFDENFNITEVVKYKRVKVSGFSLYLSMNKRKGELIKRLFEKGIMTQDGKKVRLLFSPPMRMKVRDSSILLHTSRYAPALDTSSVVDGMWTIDYTPVHFYLDSTSAKSVYGRVNIPLQRLIRKRLKSEE